MALKKILKDTLETNYHFQFNIKQTSHAEPQTYLITPSGSNSNYFQLELSVNGDTRVTIECKPEQYGAVFVEAISRAPLESRKRFISYWENINSLGKTSLRINEAPCLPNQFESLQSGWEKFDFRFTKPAYYDVERQNKEEIISRYATIICGMMLCLVDYEIEGFDEGYSEGSASYAVSKKYERNPLNRMLCLQEKGYKCSVCGFDFEKKYGSIGHQFIHVHHSVPVSEMGEGYIVNPLKELFPVCPNCHAMLHKSNPPYSIEDLILIMKKMEKN